MPETSDEVITPSVIAIEPNKSFPEEVICRLPLIIAECSISMIPFKVMSFWYS